MSLTPRFSLEDDFVNGIRCAICGNPDLKVSHLEKYPDFVTCDQCGAAFIVENEGSWVMYGKIPADYPQTSQFALRQWTWLDAVAQKAADERELTEGPSSETQEIVQKIEEISETSQEHIQQFDNEILSVKETEVPEPASSQLEIHEDSLLETASQIPSSTEGIETHPEEDLEILEEEGLEETFPDEFPSSEDYLVSPSFELFDNTSVEEEQPDIMEDELFPEIGFVDETIEEIGLEQLEAGVEATHEEVPLQEPIVSIQEPSSAVPAEETPSSTPSSVPIGEPEPDRRFRVTISGSQPKYPKNYCAHCLRTPVKLKAIMRGSLPDPNQPGKRKLVPLDLPFCQDCQKRMNAQSEEERNAKLLTFLASGLIAVLAVIVTFVLGLVNLSENLVPGLIVLLIVAVLGFAVPLLIGLTIAGKYPPPRDAAFVLSTLLVNESGEDQTEFEWRNSGYAELFRQVNQENAIGEVKQIQDRVTFTEIPSKKMQEKKKEKPKSKASRKKSSGEEVEVPDSQEEA